MNQGARANSSNNNTSRKVAAEPQVHNGRGKIQGLMQSQ
jgi:hypothetical protein